MPNDQGLYTASDVRPHPWRTNIYVVRAYTYVQITCVVDTQGTPPRGKKEAPRHLRRYARQSLDITHHRWRGLDMCVYVHEK